MVHQGYSTHNLVEACYPSQILVLEPGVGDHCWAVRKSNQKSLHVKVSMKGVNLMALVDTGVTSSFVHQSTLRKLGLDTQIRPYHHDVRFGNGEVETL